MTDIKTSRFHSSRAGIAFAHDMVMAGLSLVASLWLRLGDRLWTAWSVDRLVFTALLFSVCAGLVFLSLRLYRGIWRYASINDLINIAKAAVLSVAVFVPALFLANRLADYPRSALALNICVLGMFLGGPRLIYRYLKDRRQGEAGQKTGGRRVPVLLVGADDPAELFIRATARADAQYQTVGMLSDQLDRMGRNIHGVPVLGRIDDLEQVVADLKQAGSAPERLVVTDESLSGVVVRRLLDRADQIGLGLARLPKLTDLKSGLSDKVEIRPIAVEDLLGRAQTRLDHAAMAALIRGRKVLVTGAGGSIGSELVRQVSVCGPAALTLVESSEFALYTIDQEVRKRWPDLSCQTVLCDVRDAVRVGDVMGAAKPDLVFHAAALKHVPLVEANPLEGLHTNALGTRIVADACQSHGVALMVLISTDKAVNPPNVMGSTKRLAESYVQALDMAQSGTRYVTVRFGNVLGSTGSVVPLFQKQLAVGGPITVTDPEMTRYFMTIREAVELVLQASALGASSDAYQGRIFVLDMGEPVKIVHLARQMIRLAGLRPDEDIKIEFTGLRPGEKLYEEIFHGAEAPVPTEMDGILVAAVRARDLAQVSVDLDDLAQACAAFDLSRAMAVVRRLVPEYSGTVGQ